jgi:threonine/homoserine/homoserine lactone efflux protein
MELVFFLFQVFGISLSGALAPGPVTAAAITMGSRQRFAGTLMALGHGIVEFPLLVLLILGVGKVLQRPAVGVGIGLTGGAFLILMAIQMLRDLKNAGAGEVHVTKRGPLAAGVILSGSNPYFLIWWATVGLTLVTTAKGFGVWAFVLFAFVHWSCDLIWLTILSWTSFKGAVLLGPRGQRVVLLICALTLLGFGLWFISDKTYVLIGLIRDASQGPAGT